LIPAPQNAARRQLNLLGRPEQMTQNPRFLAVATTLAVLAAVTCFTVMVQIEDDAATVYEEITDHQKPAPDMFGAWEHKMDQVFDAKNIDEDFSDGDFDKQLALINNLSRDADDKSDAVKKNTDGNAMKQHLVSLKTRAVAAAKKQKKPLMRKPKVAPTMNRGTPAVVINKAVQSALVGLKDPWATPEAGLKNPWAPGAEHLQNPFTETHQGAQATNEASGEDLQSEKQDNANMAVHTALGALGGATYFPIVGEGTMSSIAQQAVEAAKKNREASMQPMKDDNAKLAEAVASEWAKTKGLAAQTFNGQASVDLAQLTADAAKENKEKIALQRAKMSGEDPLTVVEAQSKQLRTAQVTIQTLHNLLVQMEAERKAEAVRITTRLKAESDRIKQNIKQENDQRIDMLHGKLVQQQKREHTVLVEFIAAQKAKATAEVAKAEAEHQLAAVESAADKSTALLQGYKNKTLAIGAMAKKEKHLRMKAVSTAVMLSKRLKIANEKLADKDANTAKLKSKMAILLAKQNSLSQQYSTEKAKHGVTKSALTELRQSFGDLKTRASALSANVDWHQHAEHKLRRLAEKRARRLRSALRSCNKVEDIRKAYGVARASVARYKTENELQRKALARATEQELLAANATHEAAAHAAQIEKESLLERTAYRKLIKRAKSSMDHQHNANINEVMQMKITLEHERKLRTKAESSNEQYALIANKAQQRAHEEHSSVQNLHVSLDQERQYHAQLEKKLEAAKEIVKVEQQALLDAQAATQNIQQAQEQKMAAMEAKYHQLLLGMQQKVELFQAAADTAARDKQTADGALRKTAAYPRDEDENRQQQNTPGTSLAVVAQQPDTVGNFAEAKTTLSQVSSQNTALSAMIAKEKQKLRQMQNPSKLTVNAARKRSALIPESALLENAMSHEDEDEREYEEAHNMLASLID